MIFLVLADGAPIWDSSSLQGAMQLAERCAYDGCHVEIVTRNPSELRTWRFDHDRRAWVGSILKRRSQPPRPTSAELTAAA